MQTLLRYVLLLAWACWFGGVMFLFVAVQALFAARRDVAIEAAPTLFAAFDRYHLLLGALTLVSAGGRYLLTRARPPLVLFCCVALASLAATSTTALVTPRMTDLRLQGQSGTPEFRRLHGISSTIYLLEAAALLGAGLALPAALAATRPNPPARPEP